MILWLPGTLVPCPAAPWVSFISQVSVGARVGLRAGLGPDCSPSDVLALNDISGINGAGNRRHQVIGRGVYGPAGDIELALDVHFWDGIFLPGKGSALRANCPAAPCSSGPLLSPRAGASWGWPLGLGSLPGPLLSEAPGLGSEVVTLCSQGPRSRRKQHLGRVRRPGRVTLGGGGGSTRRPHKQTWGGGWPVPEPLVLKTRSSLKTLLSPAPGCPGHRQVGSYYPAWGGSGAWGSGDT